MFFRPITLFICLAFSLIAGAPLLAQAERQLASSGGGTAEVPGYRVDYSLGEAITQLRTDGVFTVTQGFQQPDAIGVVLPVSWLDFRARAVGKANLLRWRVQMAGEESGFRVERSTDGRSFTGLVDLPVTAPVAESRTFEWTDEDFPSEELYYRIRQTDRDGAETLSPMRRIDRRGAEQNGLLLFPNPATAAVNWRFAGDWPADGMATLRLYGTDGRLVLERALTTITGRLPLPALPPGSYTYHCILRAAAQKAQHANGILIIQ
jgi:hypothetical protein